MQNPSNAAPSSFLRSTRARWLWLAVAAAVGVWLLASFVEVDRDADAVRPKSQLEQAAERQPRGSGGRAVNLLEQQKLVQPSRPLPTRPFRVNDGESK